MSEPAPTTPAARLIARFGAKRIAGWTGRHVTRVHAWAWSTAKGGTGGVVPHRLRDKITAGAAAMGEAVFPGDFELAAGEAYLFEEAA